MFTFSRNLSTSALQEGRKRSVDNLQRLYSVVASLALTSLLTRVFIGSGASRNFEHVSAVDWLMVLSFIAVFVPFYHGANRYLDATYVTGERAAKRLGLLLDFLFLLVEAATFFVITLFVGDIHAFYSILAGLLIFDAMWVLMSEHLWGVQLPTAEAPSQFVSGKGPQRPHYIWWAILNVVAAAAIWISVWTTFWPTDIVRNASLAIIAVARSIFDYALVWSFYYPPVMSAARTSDAGIDPQQTQAEGK